MEVHNETTKSSIAFSVQRLPMEARNWVCSFSTFCTDFAIPIAKATIVNVFLTYYYRTLGKSLLWYFSLMVFCPWCTVGSMLVNVQAWIVRCPIFHSTEQRMLTTWWTCAIFCPNVQLILRKRKKKLVVSVGSHPNIGSLSGSSVAKHLRAWCSGYFRLLTDLFFKFGLALDWCLHMSPSKPDVTLLNCCRATSKIWLYFARRNLAIVLLDLMWLVWHARNLPEGPDVDPPSHEHLETWPWPG